MSFFGLFSQSPASVATTTSESASASATCGTSSSDGSVSVGVTTSVSGSTNSGSSSSSTSSSSASSSRTLYSTVDDNKSVVTASINKYQNGGWWDTAFSKYPGFINMTQASYTYNGEKREARFYVVVDQQDRRGFRSFVVAQDTRDPRFLLNFAPTDFFFRGDLYAPFYETVHMWCDYLASLGLVPQMQFAQSDESHSVVDGKFTIGETTPSMMRMDIFARQKEGFVITDKTTGNKFPYEGPAPGKAMDTTTPGVAWDTTTFKKFVDFVRVDFQNHQATMNLAAELRKNLSALLGTTTLL